MEGVRDSEERDWTEMDYIPEMHVMQGRKEGCFYVV